MDARSAVRGPGGGGSRLRTPFILVVASVSALLLLVLGLGAAGAIVAEIAGSSTPPSTAGSTSSDEPLLVPPAGTVTASPSSVPATVTTPSPTVTPTRTPATAPSPANTVPGAAHAVVGITDGDTIRVRVGGTTERVRLIGLDAPELRGSECWAQKASSKMQSLVQSRSVHLVRDPNQADRDRYGRLLRHVWTTDGQLVAEVLIRGGFARELTYDGEYEHQSTFRAAEKAAKAKRLGIWSAACAAPPVVAAPAPRTTSAAPVKPAGGCVIKGNISSKGEKIFHVPGGGSYDQTVITQSKGERWFCTEQQARDAGWRKARN